LEIEFVSSFAVDLVNDVHSLLLLLPLSLHKLPACKWL